MYREFARSAGRLAAPLAGALLIACGGGGSSSAPEPAPNRVPAFSSAAAVTISEQDFSPAYTAMAADADGDDLRYAISGGADASLFTIDPTTGALSFADPPTLGGDADGDDVYEVTLSASDGNGGSATLSVAITVQNAVPGVRFVEEIFTEVDEETNVVFAAGVEGDNGFVDLAMDIYTPAGDTATDRPVMLVAHGGGFVAGSRAEVADIARSFARRGYVAAAIDYRLIGTTPVTDTVLLEGGLRATHDLYAAVRHFRSDALGANTFGIRSDAILVTGVSAGAVMAMSAATLDTLDSFADARVADYFAANGGVFGMVGPNPNTNSEIQGALALSGAVLDLGTIDARSAVLYAAHNQNDPIVPCETAGEGSSSSGLVVSGSCAVIRAYDAVGATGSLFLAAEPDGHVAFTASETETIFTEATTLFRTDILAPGL